MDTPHDTSASADAKWLNEFRTTRCRFGARCSEGGARCTFGGHTHMRRRPNKASYAPVLCPLAGKCTDGYECKYAHSLEEVVYHPLFYNRMLCVPSLCPGRELCWMRHTDDNALPVASYATTAVARPGAPGEEWVAATAAPTVPPKPVARPKPPVVLAAEELGQMPYADLIRHCVEAIGSNQRRNPCAVKYSHVPCRGTTYDARGIPVRKCKYGERCGYAHTSAEADYHPAAYKRNMCTEGSTLDDCARTTCPHRHVNEDVRFAGRYNAQWCAFWKGKRESSAAN
jgi:hypothetical protein